jgi:hypothetical protein
MLVNFLPKTKGFFPHDFTLIASVVGESVIGHGNGICYRWFWRVSLRPELAPGPRVLVISAEERPYMQQSTQGWWWRWRGKQMRFRVRWKMVGGERDSVIGHGNGIHYRWLWHVLLRPDTGVSDDRLVCHCPISQPLTTSDGLKIQVRLRHVLRKDPTISYIDYLTNLSNESWMHVHGRYLEADLLRDPSELRM